MPGEEPFGHEKDHRALLAHLHIGRADVLGLSLGGMVAIDFALTHPDTIRSLVLVDALFSGYRFSEEWDQRTKLIWNLAREFGVAAAKESWFSHPLFKSLAERPGVAGRVREMVMVSSRRRLSRRSSTGAGRKLHCTQRISLP